MRISIEGNIGSGKTSLTSILAEELQLNGIYEEFDSNPFLLEFFNGKTTSAFPMEIQFLMDRVEQGKDKWKQANWVSDYAFCKSEVYASLNLNTTEFALYQRIAKEIEFNLPKPDVLIYLDISSERALRQIQMRGRDFERNTQLDYLNKVDFQYKEFLRNEYVYPYFRIELGDLDFIQSEADKQWLLNHILEYIKKQKKQL